MVRCLIFCLQFSFRFSFQFISLKFRVQPSEGFITQPNVPTVVTGR